MPSPETLCSLSLDGDTLDVALVRRLEAAIRASAATHTTVVVDCARVAEVTPQGLSALLELGVRTTSVMHVALAALQKPMLRAAVHVGLAERFAIYASMDAARRALGGAE